MMFGAVRPMDRTIIDVTDYALEQDVNFFDTANVYNQGSNRYTAMMVIGRRIAPVSPSTSFPVWTA
jgi:aryl-alcohol dehydrogenase-like predicted oxidoreductase